MNNSLQERIGYKFKNQQFLTQALTHPSNKKNYGGKDYERMEFLGDAILSFIISDIIYKKFPNEKEGQLAKRRAGIVCKDSLAKVALSIGLDEAILLSKGEDQSGGRENKANLENVLEAIIGAVYLDGGIENCYQFVAKNFAKLMDSMKAPPKDAKSILQEWAQGNNLGVPKYEIISITGPSHDPEIEVSVVIAEFSAIAKAKSKREAEKIVATKLLNDIGII